MAVTPTRIVLITPKRAITDADAVTAQRDGTQTSWPAWTLARRPG